ncbi:uracil-DNA glycosylase [bacterium]|nr:uracil-DNA glycosylase [bacterium]
MAAPGYDLFRQQLTAYNCQRCPRGKARNHIAIDRGKPQATILIVSERPGENEDVQGRAFVGRSGELLDRIMASIGLDTDRDLVIANVVKCKAEVDRAPSAGEVEACQPYLQRQIDLVRPQVILLLGAVALQYLVKNRGEEFSMEQEAGRLFTVPEYPGAQFMVLYHPAFLLRDPTKKAVMWEHVKRLRVYLTEHGGMLRGE